VRLKVQVNGYYKDGSTASNQMTRTTQTNILLIAISGVFIAVFLMWTTDQNSKAIVRQDSAGCWSSSCRQTILDGAVQRLSGRSPYSSDDPANEMNVDPALTTENIVDSNVE
jgi:hypothetical protein